MVATTLGRAVGHCAHCAGSGHSEPSLAFYQTAAGVFAVLLLTGIVGEIRDIRTQILSTGSISETLRRDLFRITAVLLVVMSGELIALLVLLESPSSPAKWQQVAVGVCLFVSVPGVPLLALLSLSERKLWKLAWIRRLVLAVLLAALVGVGGYLVYIAIHRSPAARYQVFGTCVAGSCGLNERSRPTINSHPLGRLQDGDIVEIVCQTHGGKVSTPEGVTSRIWDKLLNGHYVSDVSVDTPPIGSEIPACPPRHAKSREPR